jgi:hypothetical protein
MGSDTITEAPPKPWQIAEWLAELDDHERRNAILDEAVEAVRYAMWGQAREVSAAARAVLGDVQQVREVFEDRKLSVAWFTPLLGYDPGHSEEYLLAVLSIPNLTSGNILHLDPLRRFRTVGVANAVCVHPATDDNLVVELIYDRWNRDRVRSSRIGALARFAQFSPVAAAAVAVLAVCPRQPFGLGKDVFDLAVAYIATGGFGAAETFQTLVNDYLVPLERVGINVLDEGRLLGFAQLAGVL